jgi:hypothetical protein
MTTIQLDEYSIEIDSSESFAYNFAISGDDFINLNGIGYCKTQRQQAYKNHLMNVARDNLREMGAKAAENNLPSEPISKAFIEAECLNKTNRKFDAPNFAVTFKHIEDALVSAGVLVDDNNNVVKGTLFRELDEDRNRNAYQIRITVHKLN